MATYPRFQHLEYLEGTQPQDIEGRANPMERVWASSQQHIKETTMLHKWHEHDLQEIPIEKTILENWLIPSLHASITPTTQAPLSSNPQLWKILP